MEPSAPLLREWRTLPQRLQWTFEFKHPIADVWDLVTDTDRLNQARGAQPIAYRHEPLPEGGSRRIGTFKSQGVTFEWDEKPYEWVRNRYFRVERDYTRGPFKAVDSYWEFKETATGCDVTQTLSFEPRNALWKVLVQRGMVEQKRSFIRAYANLEDFLDKKSAFPFRGSSLPAASGTAPSPAFLARLKNAAIEAPTANKLASLILDTPDIDLVRIRPFLAARNLELPRKDALVNLMKATRAGILDLSWDLLCPSCRGAKSRNNSLMELPTGVHCESCNIDFGATDENSLELSFTINPAVRLINVGEFCVGGPQNTPHVAAQRILDPGQSEIVTLDLEAGSYRMRLLHNQKAIDLDVSEQAGAREHAVNLGAIGGAATALAAKPGELTLRLSNPLSHPVVVAIERTRWREDACTLGYAVSVQEFREFFPTESLRPGQEIALGSISLLFTDLKGSTALYNKIGDARSYELVEKHFDILRECVTANDGAIVKTIGDAVMAAFRMPERAVAAAIQMQKAMGAFRAKTGSPLQLKVGIHHGPCIGVTQNGRMDYFGATANLAARTEGQCQGGDIVLSRSTYEHGDVEKIVYEAGCATAGFFASLKGFSDAFELIRIDVPYSP